MAVEGLGEPGIEAHLIALRDWLVSEDALRGRVRPQRQSPLPGHMGSAMELLTVSLGSGGILAVLIQSVCTWLTSRGTNVKITISAEDGRRIEVDVQRAADPQALLREVAEQFPEPGSLPR
ncbi:effector-associated constant component EACC1 [Streptomyces noursei]|uniref:effector-associated constant component EACC1 n=1 Tax=Streptomyces noursei TaxID=1971 RepID=UPI00069D1A68|nr:hypothetical protein [Streptomyces noursei]